MIKHLTYVMLLIAAPAVAQTTGPVPSGAATPYTPAGTVPGRTASGLGPAATPGTAVVPALPQPSTGVTPPIGASTAGTIGDGSVGTLANTTSTTPPPR